MNRNKYPLIFLTLFASTVCSAAINMKTPCEEVTSHTSTDWVALFVKAQGDTTLNRVKALSRYGDCYEVKEGLLLDKLSAQERGPLMGANGDFHDFEAARDDLVEKALAVSGIDGSFKQIMQANADLYGEQFQYYFYQQYEEKPSLPPVNKVQLNKAKQKLTDILNQMAKSGKDTKALKAALATYFVEGIEVNRLPEQQLYEYPIMLLQSPEEPPFSKPPF